MRKLFLVAMLLFAASPAYAHHHAQRHHYRHRVHPMVTALGQGFGHMLESLEPHPAGCPSRAFCGCGVSVRVFGHSVRDLWLASNWFRFPRTFAHAGAVAVRSHHVFYIEEAYGDGTALAYDPNSGGHATRVHRVSLAGYAIVEP
jgi:hypothetical protein